MEEFRALRHQVSESPCIITDPRVARDNRHKLRRLPQQLGGGQVYGVKRANRLDRKWTSNARQHGVGDRDDGTATLERLQPSKRDALLGGCQATRNSRADERACGFRKRQRGSDTPTIDSQRVQRRAALFEQRGQQRARFDVPE